MTEIIQKGYAYVAQYGLSVLGAIVIFLAGRWLAGIVSRLGEKALLKTKTEKTLASFAKSIIYFAILTFAAVAALNKLGVETSSFLAIIGAAGLAVGLALQGSLSNFAAGVMMMIFRPFQLGDHIEAGGAEGTVHEIQIFTTVLVTKDQKRVIVPNAKITADKISVFPK